MNHRHVRRLASAGLMTVLLGHCGQSCTPGPSAAPADAEAPIVRELSEAPPVPSSVGNAPPVPVFEGEPGYVEPAPRGAPVISFAGRSPVRAVELSYGDPSVQSYLDAGNAVSLGWEGHEWVMGHRSSHGAVFAAAANLGPGSVVTFRGRSYTCIGAEVRPVGQGFSPPAGLTVQHSVSGSSVRLVYCR